MILLILVSLVVLLVGYAWQNTKYWSQRGINGPKSKLFIGNLDEIENAKGNSMPFKLAEWTQKYGKVYGFQRGCHNVLVLSDQKLAKEVFVEQFENFYERDINPLLGNPDKRAIAHVFNSRGLRWKRLRTLTSLVFTTKGLKKVFPIVFECANDMIDNLEEDLKSNQVINLAQNLKEYTADVILRSAFGRQEDRKFIQFVINGVLNTFNLIQNVLSPIAWVCPPLGPLLFILNQTLSFLFNKFFINFLKRVIDDIQVRKEDKDKQTAKNANAKDFIDLLVDAESEEVVLQNTASYDKKHSPIQKSLTKDEIFGTCIVFLIAGFDTTANTLAFSCYHLAKNPEIQDKIRQEIEDNYIGEDLEFDSLNKLTYLDAVMKETLRLHPIASGFTSRRCAHTTKIGNLKIEKGTDVILDVVSMHKDKEIWGEDAEEYKPERWLDSTTSPNFYGFGDGLRTCVGMRFAQLEHKVALIKLLRRYKIIEVEETKEAMTVVGAIMSPKSVKVKLQKI